MPGSATGSDTMALSSRNDLALAQCTRDSILRVAARPIIRQINVRRARHSLSELAGRLPESSGLAQIAQQPAFFDYPRERLPENFH
jgi:hypothetical protein